MRPLLRRHLPLLVVAAVGLLTALVLYAAVALAGGATMAAGYAGGAR